MMRCLLVFAKEPRCGFVKTRLLDVLSGKECVELYKAFLQDTIEIAKKVSCQLKCIAYHTDNTSPVYITQIGTENNLLLYRQEGKDFGERICNALRFAFSLGASNSVIIGTDTPNLPIEFVQSAFDALDKYDIVLGPCLDGGYYLIGAKKLYERLFSNIEWGTDRVLSQTIHRAKAMGKKLYLLERWYDVDSKDDLLRLLNDSINEKQCSSAQWLLSHLSNSFLKRFKPEAKR